MFPSVDTESGTNENVNTGIDFLFDYTAGQHIMKGATIEECDKVQTIRQYIQNVLRTQAGKYKVYTEGEEDVFGIGIYEYTGSRSLPAGYVNSDLKREVTELLLKNPEIKEVKDWRGKREKQGLDISFTAVLKDGSIIKTNEVITSVAVI